MRCRFSGSGRSDPQTSLLSRLVDKFRKILPNHNIIIRPLCLVFFVDLPSCRPLERDRRMSEHVHKASYIILISTQVLFSPVLSKDSLRRNYYYIRYHHIQFFLELSTEFKPTEDNSRHISQQFKGWNISS